MNYGYFDNQNKEYVITNPATPAPWANYLGDPDYGAIISNNAGGYSFARSGANGRILRYVFNSFDEPGRYIYIRDDDTGDYFSNTWGPVHKDLKKYKNECRHGTAYTTFKTRYSGLEALTTYYVPLKKEYEIWYLTIINRSRKTRNLTITGYCEFTNNCNYEQDQTNLQYSLFTSRTYFKGNRIRQTCDGNLIKGRPDDVSERFFGIINAEVDSYCGDKEKFLGRYNHYDKPIGVVSGKLCNDINYCMNSCGALASKIRLKPGESRKIAFIAGMKKDAQAKKIIDLYSNIGRIDREIQQLKDYWHQKLSSFQVNTPSEEFNSMINTWHSYNCFITFIWSRAASFIYCGLRNGYGYRDTVQDIQGIIHLDPMMAKEKISFMLSAQVDNGAGLPLVKFTHNAGHEDTPDDDSYVRETGHPSYRADDAMWLFPTIYKYIVETGDIEYLDEKILYANKGEASVYEHLKKAIEFTRNNIGKHNLPVGLHADWNDCLRLGKYGESTFLAFQYYYALKIIGIFAQYRNDTEYISKIKKDITKLSEALDKCYMDGRFIRGYKEDGQMIGNPKDKEANIWLNPQSWAVISGYANDKQAKSSLNMVHRRLNTEFGAKLMDPPYYAHSFPGALALTFNQGAKENSGIFLQTQGWLILAESLMGNGNRAYEYYRESCPAFQNDIADLRVLEPYCYGQFTESDDSYNFGRSHTHWLTGTASTVMVGCVEGILGIRPDLYGIKLQPAIPDEWDYLTIDKKYRGHQLHIIIRKDNIKGMTVNGKKMPDNYIPENILKKDNDIILSI
ncbi:MAG: hypothetical protein Q4D13_00910 [Erysipelotrichaceae bacterium]|nr:hypothetical protein [Erysipelotrichaceae bacterium]